MKYKYIFLAVYERNNGDWCSATGGWKCGNATVSSSLRYLVCSSDLRLAAHKERDAAISETSNLTSFCNRRDPFRFAPPLPPPPFGSRCMFNTSTWRKRRVQPSREFPERVSVQADQPSLQLTSVQPVERSNRPSAYLISELSSSSSCIIHTHTVWLIPEFMLRVCI